MNRAAHHRALWRIFPFTLLLLASAVHAHEVRPAYLELRQVGPNTYDLLWKVPARGANERLALHVRLPEDCTRVAPLTVAFTGGAYVERSRVTRPGGLTGRTISIEGLSATLTDILVRVERSDGSTQVTRLTPDQPAFVVEAAPYGLEVAHTYLMLGVEHILFGIDHLLFVLSLLLMVGGTNGKDPLERAEGVHSSLVTRHLSLLKTTTAFTVAHSITLALATLGFVQVPSAPA